MTALREAMTHLSAEPISKFSTLEEARAAVLRLPGVVEYLPDSLSIAEIDKNLETMTSEVINHIDADSMIAETANSLGWSDNERDKFFSHPERKPYKSKIELSTDFPGRLRQFLTIGTYLRLKYEQVKDEKSGERAKLNLMVFYNYSLQNLFQGFAFDFQDKVYGIDPQKRHDGMLTGSTKDMKEIFQEETQRVADTHSLDYKTLYDKVSAATEGGNFSTVLTFLWNNSGEPEVKEAMEAIFARRMKDPSLTIEQLQILWAAEVYGKLMGIDMDTYYAISGLDSGAVIESRLHDFLADQELTAELTEHIREEAPSFLAAEGERRSYFALLRARANHLGFPQESDKVSELGAKVERVWAYLRKIFPPANLGAKAGERFRVYTPTQLGAFVLRPANISYFNDKKQLVNIDVLNPREEETLLTSRAAHEDIHRIHIDILKDAYDRVPGGIKEAFAQLVETQILKILQAEKEVETQEYKNWGDLIDALIARRQAPYALTQRAVRVEMETLWKNGFHGWELSAAEAAKIADSVGPKVIEWYRESYPMADARATLLYNLNIARPMDGLDYMLEFIRKKKDYLDMKTAFRNRFGDLWLRDKDARAVLLVLMVGSSENTDISTYGGFVLPLSKDIDNVYATLKSWGISEEFV